MTRKTKWAVTVHRKNGEKSSTVLHHAPDAAAAVNAAADNLDLEIDDAGNVIGDAEIARLTAEAAPNAPEHEKL